MNAVLNYKDKNFLVSDFEITIDVSLDSNCGVFRRYHVGNNPIIRNDPLGLFPNTPGGWIELMKKVLGAVEFCKKCKDIEKHVNNHGDQYCSDCCEAVAKKLQSPYFPWKEIWQQCYGVVCI
jgi:hypothetical protein